MIESIMLPCVLACSSLPKSVYRDKRVVAQPGTCDQLLCLDEHHSAKKIKNTPKNVTFTFLWPTYFFLWHHTNKLRKKITFAHLLAALSLLYF